jgi:hypothetical protein
MMKSLFALPVILLATVGCSIDGKLLNEIDDDLWTKICDKATDGL